MAAPVEMSKQNPACFEIVCRKSNIDTKNDGLENVYISFQTWLFWISMSGGYSQKKNYITNIP